MPSLSGSRLIPLAGVVVALLAAALAWAGPPTDQLRTQVDRVMRILEDPELRKDGRAQERRASLRDAASQLFDFPEISRRALGRHWQARTPDERAEFTRLFTDLLEYSYVSKIETYSSGDDKVQYTGERVDGDYALVNTKILRAQGVEIPVDYRMYREGSRWRAYDVNIEGVSLVANYRSQFNSILQRQSYPELVKMVRTKLAQLSDHAGSHEQKPGAAAPAAGKGKAETP